MTDVDHWPADIRESFERLGLFDKYSPTTAHGVFQHLNGRHLTGLISNVKGIDQELQTVHDINAGAMPSVGDHADLAAALNQPGWDIETLSNGEHAQYLQSKATPDWHQLAHHLARYPQYPDLVANTEAIQGAAQHGMDTSHMIDVGSSADLTSHVTDSLQHISDSHAVHELLPEVAVAAILAVAVVRLRKGEGVRDTGRWVKEQTTVAGAANLAGLAVQVATGTVVLRPVAAIGTRYAIARGKFATQVAERFQQHRAVLEATLAGSADRGYRSDSAQA
jgi:hypothetical protein